MRSHKVAKGGKLPIQGQARQGRSPSARGATIERTACGGGWKVSPSISHCCVSHSGDVRRHRPAAAGGEHRNSQYWPAGRPSRAAARRVQRKHTMLSEGLKSRDSLKLSFNRSISEPGHAGLTTCPMAPLTSPPSLGPSLHPPKRCRMDGLSRSKPLSLAPPSSFLSPPAPPGGVVSLPASPCSESVTMQRSMVMQQATTISGDQLAKRLRAREGRPGRQSFLLLDCRPFIAYNVGHVRGAINVNCCDRFNRKRLQQVKARNFSSRLKTFFEGRGVHPQLDSSSSRAILPNAAIFISNSKL